MAELGAPIGDSRDTFMIEVYKLELTVFVLKPFVGLLAAKNQIKREGEAGRGSSVRGRNRVEISESCPRRFATRHSFLRAPCLPLASVFTCSCVTSAFDLAVIW